MECLGDGKCEMDEFFLNFLYFILFFLLFSYFVQEQGVVVHTAFDVEGHFGIGLLLCERGR